MNQYVQFQETISKERNDLISKYMFFAFNKEQFEEGKAKLPNAKLVSYLGGFIDKSKVDDLKKAFANEESQLQQAIQADLTGEEFIYDMFSYELANHEYGYTRDHYDALAALGLTIEEINSNPALLNGFEKAKKDCIEYFNLNS